MSDDLVALAAEAAALPRAELIPWIRRAGRNDAPVRLYVAKHRLSLEEQRELLPEVWCLAEWPESFGQRRWVELFGEIGFISSPPGTAPPSEPLQLFRGCAPGMVKRMSWTTSRDKAEWFARRFLSINEPKVLASAIAPPSAVLALIDDRNEAEVVVDPRRLRAVQVVERFTARSAQHCQ